MKKRIIKKMNKIQRTSNTEPYVVRDRKDADRAFTLISRIQKLDGSDDEIELAISSEKPVRRWGEDEVLLHTQDSVNFSPILSVGAILKNHDPNMIVGIPISGRVDNDNIARVRMRFGTTEKALEAKHEVLVDGSLRGVSVGGYVNKWLYFENDGVYAERSFKAGTWLAVEWEVREASLTPTPADTDAGVGRMANNEQKTDRSDTVMKKKVKLLRDWQDGDTLHKAGEIVEVEIIGCNRMVSEGIGEEYTERAEKTDIKKPTAKTETVQKMEVLNGVTQKDIDIALENERQRMIDGQIIVRDFNLGDEGTKMVMRGASLEQMREYALGVVRQRGVDENKTTVERGVDGRDTFIRAMSVALQTRAGAVVDVGEVKAVGGTEMANYSLVRMAEECLRRANISIPSDSRTLVDMALRHNTSLFHRTDEAITVGVSDFPYILANTANKEMLRGAGVAPTTYRSICRIGNLSDFKLASRLKISEAGELKLVPEFGTYQDTKFSESRETIQLATYGRTCNLSRQAIINDDLDAFTAMPYALGIRAASKPNEMFVTLLLSNPTMSDGNALFSAAHNNLNTETDYALDTVAHARAGLQNMVNMFMEQEAFMPGGEQDDEIDLGLAVTPGLFYVPTGGYLNAKTVLGTGATDSNTPDYNALFNIAPVITERLLSNTKITGYSTTAYYSFASPAINPCFEVAFLNGVQTPYMEEVTNDGRSADGIVMKVRMDCAVAAIDWRGAVKETGVDA